MTFRGVGLIITLALTIVLLTPHASDAQVPKAVPHIGVLGTDPESGEYFREALRELGYLEGHTIAVEYRWAAGRVDRLPELAAELVRLKVDVIVAITLLWPWRPRTPRRRSRSCLHA